eukprot:gene12901-biopygen591
MLNKGQIHRFERIVVAVNSSVPSRTESLASTRHPGPENPGYHRRHAGAEPFDGAGWGHIRTRIGVWEEGANWSGGGGVHGLGIDLRALAGGGVGSVLCYKGFPPKIPMRVMTLSPDVPNRILGRCAHCHSWRRCGALCHEGCHRRPWDGTLCHVACHRMKISCVRAGAGWAGLSSVRHTQTARPAGREVCPRHAQPPRTDSGRLVPCRITGGTGATLCAM